MEFRASHRYAHISAKKARPSADLIRGLAVGRALDLLGTHPARGSSLFLKVLRSAIANAEERAPNLDVEELFVKEAFVNMGPTKNRYRVRPAPMGRAFRERRQQSHITVRISDGQDEEE